MGEFNIRAGASASADDALFYVAAAKGMRFIRFSPYRTMEISY